MASAPTGSGVRCAFSNRDRLLSEPEHRKSVIRNSRGTLSRGHRSPTHSRTLRWCVAFEPEIRRTFQPSSFTESPRIALVSVPKYRAEIRGKRFLKSSWKKDIRSEGETILGFDSVASAGERLI